MDKGKAYTTSSKTNDEVNGHDMNECGLEVEDEQERRRWKMMVGPADPRPCIIAVRGRTTRRRSRKVSVKYSSENCPISKIL